MEKVEELAFHLREYIKEEVENVIKVYEDGLYKYDLKEKWMDIEASIEYTDGGGYSRSFKPIEVVDFDPSSYIQFELYRRYEPTTLQRKFLEQWLTFFPDTFEIMFSPFSPIPKDKDHQMKIATSICGRIILQYFKYEKQPVVSEYALSKTVSFALEPITTGFFKVMQLSPLSSSTTVEEEFTLLKLKDVTISVEPASDTHVKEHYRVFHRYSKMGFGEPFLWPNLPVLVIERRVHLRQVSRVRQLFDEDIRVILRAYSIASGHTLRAGPPISKELTWSTRMYGSSNGFSPKVIDEWPMHGSNIQAGCFSEWAKLTNSYKKISNAKAHRPASVAVERYYRGLNDENPTDAIPNFMIAFEALFLHQKETTELSRTLKQRVSVGIFSTKAERKAVRDIIGYGYDARSQVVHGEKWRHSSETQTGGEFDRVLWTKLCSQIAKILNRAINVYVSQVLSSKLADTATFISNIDKAILATPSPFELPTESIDFSTQEQAKSGSESYMSSDIAVRQGGEHVIAPNE